MRAHETAPRARAAATKRAPSAPPRGLAPLRSGRAPDEERRPCACGGGCPRCRGGEPLRLGAVGDPGERAASRAATALLKAPSDALSAALVGRALAAPLGGRGEPLSPVACEALGRALEVPGEPLPGAERARFERRLGAPLSDVRIHSGEAASAAAEAVGAAAFTVGGSVVLGRGAAGQGPRARRSILAHEVAHAVHQRRSGAVAVQRTVTLDPDVGELYLEETTRPVDPRRQRFADLRGYVAELSPDFRVETTGELAPNTGTCAGASRITDTCLCEMCAAPTPWTVVIDDTQWPHTESDTHRVILQSTLTPMAKGAWGGGASAGTRIFESGGRIFGHELCGHAWLIERGVHPTAAPVYRGGRYMARPSHDPTVMIENAIAGEMAALRGGVAEERGLYTSPHSGESWGLVRIENFAFGSTAMPAAMGPRLDLIARFVHETEARNRRRRAPDPTVGLDVIGHADHVGAAWANDQASRGRAYSVVSALGSRGVPSSRCLTIEGRGDRECPPSAGRDDSCRRVDVYMFGAKAASERYPASGAMTPQIAAEQSADIARILAVLSLLGPALTRP